MIASIPCHLPANLALASDVHPSIKMKGHITNDLDTLYQLPLSHEMHDQPDLIRKERVSIARIKKHRGLGTIDWQRRSENFELRFRHTE